MSTKYLYIFLLLSLLGLNACKSKKAISIVKQNAINVDSVHQHIFNPPQINWFTGRAKVKITSPNVNEKFVMFIRMKHDSIIWTSFKKYGAEGARVLIDKDSVFIVNRQAKTYDILSLNQLSNSFGLTPDLLDIQSLIKAQIPKIDTTILWETREDEDFYSFRSIKGDILYNFSYEKISGKLKKGHFIDRFSSNGFWDYDDYRIVDNIAVPFFRKYTAEFGPDNFLNVTLEFTDIELNKANSTKFSIPAHYERNQ